MKQPIKKTDRKKVVINDAFRIHPSKSADSIQKRRKAKLLTAKRAKAKAAKKAEEAVQAHQIKYIVVHSIGYSDKVSLATIEQLDFDYIITPHATIISHTKMDARKGTIEIGLIGGYDEQGVLEDNHSEQQKDALIHLLMDLMQHFPQSIVRSADELYTDKMPNPSFSMPALVMARIIDALQHLAIKKGV